MPLDIQIILLIFGSGLFMGLFLGALFVMAIIGRQAAEAGGIFPGFQQDWPVPEEVENRKSNPVVYVYDDQGKVFENAGGN